MNPQLCVDPRQVLRESVEQLVRTRIGSLVRGLRVDVQNQDVVLSGRASTFYAKQLATHAAMSHSAFSQDALSADTPFNVTNAIEVD